MDPNFEAAHTEGLFGTLLALLPVFVYGSGGGEGGGGGGRRPFKPYTLHPIP